MALTVVKGTVKNGKKVSMIKGTQGFIICVEYKRAGRVVTKITSTTKTKAENIYQEKLSKL
jgi:hypothetical protein